MSSECPDPWRHCLDLEMRHEFRQWQASSLYEMRISVVCRLVGATFM